MNDEEYLLLLLADGNLPTGSFVASSGLESYIKHGFGNNNVAQKTYLFIQDSVASYTRSSLPFVTDVHKLLSNLEAHDDPIPELKKLDMLYDDMTLNHVTRRASKSQGVALLTLYSKGLSKPAYLLGEKTLFDRLVDRYKLLVRKGEVHGHLPVCWAILTASLGLSLARSQYLHIFLHARSLLSAAVRLNDIGPYNAQQLLLHLVKPVVEAETTRCKNLDTDLSSDEGPANTWPLGEILAARHDLQHSRIFNS